MIRSLFLIALLALVACTAGPGYTANPKVTLKLDNVTLEETLAAVSKATGISLQTQTQAAGAIGVRPAGAGEVARRASFQWQETSFARVLRDLCKEFNQRPMRRFGGYTLYPSFEPPPPLQQGRRVGEFEKNGIRFYVRSVSMYESRNINFGEGAPQQNAYGSVNIQLQAELGDAEADSVAGLRDVSARDDTGVLVRNAGESYYSSYSSSGYPDEWSGGVSFQGLSPKARKIQWIEADLMVYRKNREVAFEIPLPLSGKLVKKQVGDVLVAVSRYEAGPGPEEKDEEDEGLPEIGNFGGQVTGPSMRVRVFLPSGGPRLVARSGGYGYQPQIVGKSGRVYAGMVRRSTGRGNGQMTVQDMDVHFPGLQQDEPQKLVWEFVERNDPERLMRIRLQDIPLPDAGQAPRPQPVVPGRVAPRQPPPDRPFYEEGGAVLAGKVELPNRRAEGMVQVGLAPKAGTGWGAVRWQDVTLFSGGFRLEDVKPGVYRLLLKYRPEDPASLRTLGAGRWTNAEGTVTLVAGKEQTLPPLRWSSGAPPPRGRG